MVWLVIASTIFVLFVFVVIFGAPYVPSQRRYTRRAFDELYKVGPKDVLVDFGSGDGLVLREAARRGASAIGYEINPILLLISRLLSLGNKNIRIVPANYWLVKLPKEVTVVYMFGVNRDRKRLERMMQRQADRLGRPLSLMCFGSLLQHTKPIKTFEAYALYVFHPLQSAKAQV